MFAYVSLTWDLCAIRDMVLLEVWANLLPDLEITELEAWRAELKQGCYRFDGLVGDVKIWKLMETIWLKKLQCERWIVKEYCEYYFYNRLTWDLER